VAAAAALAAHRETCPICQAAAAELATARALIGRGELYEPAPEELRRRIMSQLAAARTLGHAADSPAAAAWPLRWWRGWWSGAAGFGIGAACAAALAVLLLAPGEATLTEAIVAGHIR